MNLPRGYRYSALYAGIRKVAKPDLVLMVSDTPATAAAMFTTNQVKAAPVRLGESNLAASKGMLQAVLVNAGNANCATRTGDRVAKQTAAATAKALKIKPALVLPSSTGVIGVEMDGSKIINALPELVAGLSPDRFLDAADAILTTDTFRKVSYAEAGGAFLCGMTKGAGMIQPNMATTLGYVMSDAVVDPETLRKMLKRAVDRSYHRLSVDGDTSTNDTVAVLANGASGVKAGKEFEQALTKLLEDLAQQIARDGEGARKLIHISVEGARNDSEAARLARSIANSPLVKTAVAGSDANWGRILCAAGYAGVAFEPTNADVYLQGTRVCRRGLAAPYDEPALVKRLDEKDCHIRLVFSGNGKGMARFWTCDLTEGYIRINGSYRT